MHKHLQYLDSHYVGQIACTDDDCDRDYVVVVTF